MRKVYINYSGQRRDAYQSCLTSIHRKGINVRERKTLLCLREAANSSGRRLLKNVLPSPNNIGHYYPKR